MLSLSLTPITGKNEFQKQNNQYIADQMAKKFKQNTLEEIQIENFDGSTFFLKTVYHCTWVIGVGGFGFVVEAFDPIKRQKYALKIMERETSNDEALDCLRNEATVLQMFDDKRVIKFWFFQEFRSHLILGMEICRGGSLKDLIKQRNMMK